MFSSTTEKNSDRIAVEVEAPDVAELSHRLSLDHSSEIGLEWVDLAYRLPQETVRVGKGKGAATRRQEILSGLTGRVEAGKLVCILGPSGSGKTTFLNLLAGRVSEASIPGSALSGSVSLDGLEVDPVSMKKHFAYVMAEDSLFATMTPREALEFAGHLRLPPKAEVSKYRSCDELGQKMNTLSNPSDVVDVPKKVEDLIQVLGLSKCCDAMVGNELIKGVSSGERKRTAVGVELITDPRMVFLDEPTSGLDSYTAFKLISGPLKELAKGKKRGSEGDLQGSGEGRVVVATIHQPSSEIFFEFDEVMVMSGLLEGEEEDWKEEEEKKLVRLQESVSSVLKQMILAKREVKKSSGSNLPPLYVSPFFKQQGKLFVREVQRFVRDKQSLAGRFLVGAILACIFGSIFFGVADYPYMEEVTQDGRRRNV